MSLFTLEAWMDDVLPLARFLISDKLEARLGGYCNWFRVEWHDNVRLIDH